MPDASVLFACASLLSTKEEIRTLRALAPAWRPPGVVRHGSRHECLVIFCPALISLLLVSLSGSTTPEEVLRRPPHEAWTLARVLDALLVNMSRTACSLSHAAGRRQASLVTPIPKTPTVAPGPKVHSGLASWRSQGPNSEHRGPPKPVTLVDAWRLIGRGRLRFPMLPRQLHDLTSPCDMQGRPSLPVIVGGAG